MERRTWIAGALVLGLGAGMAQAVTIVYDSNGFESPTFTGGDAVADQVAIRLNGQDGWTVDSVANLRIRTTDPLKGLQSVQPLGAAQATRAVSITPDATFGTQVLMSAIMGHPSANDVATARIGVVSTGALINNATGSGVYLMREDNDEYRITLRVSGANIFSTDQPSVNDIDSNNIDRGIEKRIGLRYMPGTNNDELRFEFRRDGDLAWTAIPLPASLFAPGGFNGFTAVATTDGFSRISSISGSFDLPLDRIYLASAGSSNMRIDDVLVTSSVIPEPASLSLLAASGLILLSNRRKR